MENKKQKKLKNKTQFCGIFVILTVLLPYCFGSSLAGDTKGSSIQEVNKALLHTEHSLTKGRKTATKLDNELGQISREVSIFQQELVSITNKIRLSEAHLNNLTNELQYLEQQLEQKQLEFANAKKELREVISVLQRVSYVPAELAIFIPTSVKKASHTKVLLSSIAQSLTTRTFKLRKEIALLDNRGKERLKRKSNINFRIKHLKSQHVEFKKQLSQKILLKHRTTIMHEDTANTLKQLTAKTKNLEALLARLIQNIERRTQQKIYSNIPSKSELSAKTDPTSAIVSTDYKIVRLRHLRMPIQGRVVSHFNETTEFGFLTKGISIRTNLGAEVRAPSEGRIVFAGPFHEYGMLLIIDHGAGYHTVLAGFDHIYKTSDQYVLSGEPVGAMNSPNDKQPELYMELRRRGHPINPIPWIETNNNKISGG